MSECKLCNAPLDGAAIVGLKARFGHASRRVVCMMCGLVQVSPQPSTESLLAYYRDGYRKEYGAVPKVKGKRIIHPDEHDYEAILDELGEQYALQVIEALSLQPGDPLFEIGCSEGRALSALLKAGIDAKGCDADPGEIAKAELRLPARTVAVGALDDLDVSPERLRNVAMWHVLEHLSDPVAALRSLITKGAQRIYVEVPNVDAYSLDRESVHYQHVHLFDFSATTLVSVLQAAGFGAISVVPFGTSLCAWGTAGAPPIISDDPLDRVESLQREPMPEQSADDTDALSRWLAGESLGEIGVDEQAIREALASVQQHVKALEAGYSDTAGSLRALQSALIEDGRRRVESYNRDAFMRGMDYGAGTALERAAIALGHLAHRMCRVSGELR